MEMSESTPVSPTIHFYSLEAKRGTVKLLLKCLKTAGLSYLLVALRLRLSVVHILSLFASRYAEAVDETTSICPLTFYALSLCCYTE